MAQVNRGGQPHQGRRPVRMSPHEALTQEFGRRPRGLDPDQVREFQARVAAELADLHRHVRLLVQKNTRLTHVLRDWRTLPTREPRPPEEHHGNQGW
ncbi:DivIVA domain-containing protein [Micromonospora sp. DT233]|uniref:DivIVA domain-containing protein n=1 Tax=Micromonospora sp. DT233 TaxID=3393432 RepID=UPI003CF2F9CB